MSAAPEPAGPLSGVRVLDLTQMLAGPFCTMLLADLGADVVKVESPAGDLSRPSGPFRADDDVREFGGYFQSVNRSKRSIVLDLRSEEDRDVFRRLVRRVDLLVENYRVGVMDRLGLSYESLAELNPALVYVAIRGFGDPRTGVSPYVDWPALDVVAQAMGGVLGITGPAGGPPTKVGPGVGDIFPGTLAAVGALAALTKARETGQGQFVDVALYDGILALCERIVHQHSYTGAVPGPEGNAQSLLSPFGVFPTTDGWVSIAAPFDHHWRLLCAAMADDALGTDPELATNAGRVARGLDVQAAVGRWTRDRTTAEVLASLGGAVPVGPVNSVADIFADPHVAARGMLVELPHPGTTTPVRVAGTPLKFTGTPTGPLRRAPRLGEHSDEIRQAILSTMEDEA